MEVHSPSLRKPGEHVHLPRAATRTSGLTPDDPPSATYESSLPTEFTSEERSAACGQAPPSSPEEKPKEGTAPTSESYEAKRKAMKLMQRRTHRMLVLMRRYLLLLLRHILQVWKQQSYALHNSQKLGEMLPFLVFDNLPSTVVEFKKKEFQREAATSTSKPTEVRNWIFWK